MADLHASEERLVLPRFVSWGEPLRTLGLHALVEHSVMSLVAWGEASGVGRSALPFLPWGEVAVVPGLQSSVDPLLAAVKTDQACPVGAPWGPGNGTTEISWLCATSRHTSLGNDTQESLAPEQHYSTTLKRGTTAGSSM